MFRPYHFLTHQQPSLLFLFHHGGGSDKNFAIASSVVGQWTHIIVSRISNTIRVYANGVESTSGGQTESRGTNFDKIGHLTTGDGVDGLVDEFALLVGAGATLTDAVNLYNGGVGADFLSIMGSANLYYHLDETGTATTAVDASGNGKDGTLINFPASGMWVPHI